MYIYTCIFLTSSNTLTLSIPKIYNYRNNQRLESITVIMETIAVTKIIVLVLALFIIKKIFFDRKKSGALLPPGPKGLPFVGNITDLPPPGIPESQHWLKHKELYGPISSLTVLGQTIIIIHDKNVALELMEKRSSIYSGRPRMVFAFEMYLTPN